MRQLKFFGKYPGTLYGARACYDNSANFGKYFYHGKAFTREDIVGIGHSEAEAEKDFKERLKKENEK